MPLECRFNTLSDELTREEFNMYTYATRIWLLQDKLGVSFENASLSNTIFRHRVEDYLMEFRYDSKNLSYEEQRDLEKRMWSEFREEEESIKKWSEKNLKRFQGNYSKLIDVCYIDEPPEFDCYY